MKQKIECSICPTVACFIKRYCKGDELTMISKNKNQNTYVKGDAIFREGNTMNGIHFIQHGGAKIITTNLNGREQVVRFATEGSVIGHRVLGNDKYYFNCIAILDSNICFIESSLFLEVCMNNPEFSYHLVLFYAYELRKSELRIKFQAQMNVREKVAEAFISLVENFGVNATTKTINVELSRQDIADIAGTTSEQISRHLFDFENEKSISRSKRTIQILDIKKLENIVRNYKTELFIGILLFNKLLYIFDEIVLC